jgi:hypothetical protein
MKERPILMSAAMVRAILDGRKTQTRRVLKGLEMRSGMPEPEFASLLRCCPYGVPGERLWVREAWQSHIGSVGESLIYAYRATDDHRLGPWRPSIHMPRVASRITLEVAGVRVERLQDISEADARAEGTAELPGQHGEPAAWWTADVGAGPRLHGRTARDAYRFLWEQINGPGSWDANLWVWVIEFAGSYDISLRSRPTCRSTPPEPRDPRPAPHRESHIRGHGA